MPLMLSLASLGRSGGPPSAHPMRSRVRARMRGGTARSTWPARRDAADDGIRDRARRGAVRLPISRAAARRAGSLRTHFQTLPRLSSPGNHNC
ncbi:putative fimbrial assembly chaperone protein [Burkholderia pseudomallei MSHR7334]|nr:putative fimbrial assembly chaperone protein [Burkholderia pseudomallei MSHR7334]